MLSRKRYKKSTTVKFLSKESVFKVAKNYCNEGHDKDVVYSANLNIQRCTTSQEKQIIFFKKQLATMLNFKIFNIFAKRSRKSHQDLSVSEFHTVYSARDVVRSLVLICN